MIKLFLLTFTLLLSQLSFAEKGASPAGDKQAGMMREGAGPRGGMGGHGARQGGGMGAGGRGMGMMAAMQELNLSTEQMNKLKEFKKIHLETQLKNKNQQSELNLQFQNELSNKNQNEKKLNELIEKIGNNMKARLHERVQALKDFKTVLTEEQINKLDMQRLFENNVSAGGRGMGMDSGL